MHSDAYHSHMPGKYWFIQYTPTIHNSSVPSICQMVASPLSLCRSGYNWSCTYREADQSCSTLIQVRSRGKAKSAGTKDFTLTPSLVLGECASHSLLATIWHIALCWYVYEPSKNLVYQHNVSETTSCIYTSQYNDGSDLLVAEVCVPKITWLLDGIKYHPSCNMATHTKHHLI